MHQMNGSKHSAFNFERKDMAKKVVRTFTVSESRELVSVNIAGDTTDILERVILTDADSGQVVCDQKIRTSIPTEEARAVIEAATKVA